MDYVIDAKDRPLGRVATEAARVLQGKHTPKYEKRLAGEGRVVVRNIKEIVVTGKKFEDKTYYRHTGYMGHLKSKSYRQVFEANPGWVLRHAVRGMLPKNFLRDRRMKRLIIQ